MATRVITISSSPPRPPPAEPDVTDYEDSPYFPTLSTLFRVPISTSKLKSGSNATPIAAGAVLGFQSAKVLAAENGLDLRLLKQSPPEGHVAEINEPSNELGSAGVPNASGKAKRGTKPTSKRSNATVKGDEDKRTVKEQIPRKKRVVDPDKEENTEAKKKSRKPQQKDAENFPTSHEASLQTVPQDHIATEAPVVGGSPNIQAQLNTLKVTKPVSCKKKPRDSGIEPDLELLPAVKRRRDWTPPIDTTPSIPTEALVLDLSETPPSLFRDLHGQFGYNHQTPTTSIPQKTSMVEESTSKRCRLSAPDVAPVLTPPIVTTAAKVRTGPKYLRTVTNIAIAQYSTSAPLAAKSPPKIDPPVEVKTKARKKSPRKKGKVDETPQPILRSPQSALQSIRQQEVFFCTSSQLGEPVRRLSDVLGVLQDSTSNGKSEAGQRQTVSLRKGLWAEAARINELVDLAMPESPESPKRPTSLDYNFTNDTTEQSVDASRVDKLELDHTIDALEGRQQFTVQTAIDRDGIQTDAIPSVEERVVAPFIEVHKSKPRTPKRKKKTQHNPIVIDEIEDSEPDCTPSPPRREFPEPPVELDLLPNTSPQKASDDKPSKDNPRPSDAELFSSISEVIRSAPRSNDPKQPSWYEKILLYDPLILEDLAAWLNGHERIKMSGGVEAAFVQKWCERHSICCIWKDGVWGRVRHMQ